MLPASRIEEEADEVKRLGLRPKVEPFRIPPFRRNETQKSTHRQPSKSDMVSFKRVLDTVRLSCYAACTRSRAHQVFIAAFKPHHGNQRPAAVMPQVTLRNLPVLRSYK